MEKMKVLQMRATLEDTERYQNELFILLRKKIKENTYLFPLEKDVFPSLTAKALLSQAYRHCYYVTGDNKKIDLGSIRFLCLNLLDISSDKITIVDPNTRERYVISIDAVWRILYNKCKETSQSALREALKMSKEIPKREEPSSLDYSSDD